jgi:hypothetical protein
MLAFLAGTIFGGVVGGVLATVYHYRIRSGIDRARQKAKNWLSEEHSR